MYTVLYSACGNADLLTHDHVACCVCVCTCMYEVVMMVRMTCALHKQICHCHIAVLDSCYWS